MGSVLTFYQSKMYESGQILHTRLFMATFIQYIVVSMSNIQYTDIVLYTDIVQHHISATDINLYQLILIYAMRELTNYG